MRIPQRGGVNVVSVMWLILTGCNHRDVLKQMPVCGNDEVEGTEVCDGTDLNGATCANTTGLGDGTLRCDASCGRLLTADCTDCGDGEIDASEQCEQGDLGGFQCSTVDPVYTGGFLQCDANTCLFDTSLCQRCGDQVLDKAEACDGRVPVGQTCQAMGFEGGAVACDAATCELDTSGCYLCGNGVVEDGEACDDGNRGNRDSCTNACALARCGDGIVWDHDGGHERCDDGEANDDDAPTACRTTCVRPVCGDGLFDPGEACELAPPWQHHCCELNCSLTAWGGSDPQGVCLNAFDELHVCDGAGACIAIPEEQLTPLTKMDGLPSPVEGVYRDLGVTPDDDLFRALIGFPLRHQAELRERIDRMYDPADGAFRQYMTPSAWIERHAPSQQDFDLIKAWVEKDGMQVNFEATNRLLLQFTGTAAQFNATFGAVLHTFSRRNPQSGNPPIEVYGTLERFTVPTFVAERITGVITADRAADPNDLPSEAGEVEVAPPDSLAARTVEQIANAYALTELYQSGYKGAGVKLGVCAGATFKLLDLESFWLSMGITRPLPTVVETMEPVATRYIETTLDTQWAGALAPEAELIVYEGPDSRNTSMVYSWNEAIARAEVSVLTTSFAHREDSEPKLVRDQYNHSSMMGAALGMTLMAASGDSGKPDVPSSSPFVTAVGGTRLNLDAMGNVSSERAWGSSGSGIAKTFAMPDWQQGVVTGSDGKRAVVDVSMNASPQTPYWVYYLGVWRRYGGTSFSAPAFAGLMAVLNSYRIAQGKPVAGFINPSLYRDANVQGTFRDIVSGATSDYAAGAAWDYPTGWGAPQAAPFAAALP